MTDIQFQLSSLTAFPALVLLLELRCNTGMISKNNKQINIITPQFTLESVSVFPAQLESVSNSTEHNITATWSMIFNVKKPSDGNHLLFYSDIAVEIYYWKCPLRQLSPLLPVGLNIAIPPWMTTAKSLWSTVIPGFHQAQQPHQEDLVKVTFAPAPVTIDSSLAASLMKDIDSGASFGFFVRLDGNVTQQEQNLQELKMKTGPATAHCDQNMAFLQTGGVMASSSKECKVLVRNGLMKGWMLHAISVAVVHVILRACFKKFLDKN